MNSGNLASNYVDHGCAVELSDDGHCEDVGGGDYDWPLSLIKYSYLYNNFMIQYLICINYTKWTAWLHNAA